MPNIKKIRRQEYLKKIELLFAVVFSLFLITKFTSQTYAAAPPAAPSVAAVADSTWDARYNATTNKAKSATGALYKWYVDSSNVLHIGRGTFDVVNNSTAKAATSIVIDQKVTAATSLLSAFASSKATSITGFENLNMTSTASVSNMFGNMPNLVGLDLSKLNTSNVQFFSSMFQFNDGSSTPKLTGLRLNGSFTTAKATDFEGMFSGQSQLDTIVGIDAWNVSKVTTFAFMFNNNQKLTTLDFSKWRPTAAVSMRAMFQNSNVNKVDGALWGGTPNLTETQYMFTNSSSLNGATYIDLRGLTMNKVTSATYMFSGQANLTTLNTTGWNLSSVSNTTNMFRNVSSLTTLDVSTYGMANATSLAGMFDGMNSVTSLNVTNWNVSKVTNMSFLFNATWALTTADLSKWRPNAVTNMSSMFQSSNVNRVDGALWGGTPNLTSSSYMFNNAKGLPGATYIDLRGMTMNKVTTTYRMFAEQKNVTTLNTTGWVLSENTTSVQMFLNVSSLKALDVSTYAMTNSTNLSYMFQGASSITSLNVANWNVSKVTTMRGMFSIMTSLTSIDVSKWVPTAVTTTHDMFSRSTSLTSIALTNWNTPNLTSMRAMFNQGVNNGSASGSKLKTVTFGTNFNVTKVTDIGWLFNMAEQLTSTNVGSLNFDSLTDINNSINGTALTSLSITNWIDSKPTNMSNAFSRMPNLTSLDLTGLDMTSTSGDTKGILIGTSKLQTFTAGTKTKFYANPDSILWSAFSNALAWETGNFVLSTDKTKVFRPGTAYNFNFSTATGKYIREENNTVAITTERPTIDMGTAGILPSSSAAPVTNSYKLYYTNTIHNTGNGAKLVAKLSADDSSDFIVKIKLASDPDTAFKEITTSGVTLRTSTEKVWEKEIPITITVTQRPGIKPKTWSRDIIYEVSKG